MGITTTKKTFVSLSGIIILMLSASLWIPAMKYFYDLNTAKSMAQSISYNSAQQYEKTKDFNEVKMDFFKHGSGHLSPLQISLTNGSDLLTASFRFSDSIFIPFLGFKDISFTLIKQVPVH